MSGSNFNEILKKDNGKTELKTRKKFASKAFNNSSHYDTAIFKYFNIDLESEFAFKQSIMESKKLRYGENPHQKGVFYGNLEDILQQLHGKEMSYK